MTSQAKRLEEEHVIDDLITDLATPLHIEPALPTKPG
jgi:hypothetical protein